MIAHQYVRMHRTAELPGEVHQVMRAERIGLLPVDTRAAVIKLYEVQRQTSYSQACGWDMGLANKPCHLPPAINAPALTTADPLGEKP